MNKMKVKEDLWRLQQVFLISGCILKVQTLLLDWGHIAVLPMESGMTLS